MKWDQEQLLAIASRLDPQEAQSLMKFSVSMDERTFASLAAQNHRELDALRIARSESYSAPTIQPL